MNSIREFEKVLNIPYKDQYKIEESKELQIKYLYVQIEELCLEIVANLIKLLEITVKNYIENK